jgi:uncharacterized protein (UPF0335 family)
MEIISVDNEIKNHMKDGIARILYIDKEIKSLQEDKKTIKQEMKEQGVDMKLANKILTLLKRKAKEGQDPIVNEALNLVDEFYEDDNIGTILDELFDKNK